MHPEIKWSSPYLTKFLDWSGSVLVTDMIWYQSALAASKSNICRLTFSHERTNRSNFIYIKGMNTLSSEKGSTLKPKNLLPLGANSFLFE